MIISLRSSALLVTAAALAIASPAQAEDYKADTAHSSVNFEVRHLFSKVRGNFKKFSGGFSFDEKKPEASKADFSVKASSVNTENEQRDEHLRGADFFNAAKNEDVTFKSKSIKADGAKKYKLAGDLTLRGVTKPVSFDVEFLGAGKDPMKRETASFSATTTINRKDYGMIWNKVADAGGVVVGDDVKIEVLLEGEKTKLAEAQATKKN